jgi:hypothetical protein
MHEIAVDKKRVLKNLKDKKNPDCLHLSNLFEK